MATRLTANTVAHPSRLRAPPSPTSGEGKCATKRCRCYRKNCVGAHADPFGLVKDD